MEIERKAAEALLENFREIFLADGGDLILEYCDIKQARFQILIGPEACRECIMDADTVKEIFRENLESQLGHPIDVQVEKI